MKLLGLSYDYKKEFIKQKKKKNTNLISSIFKNKRKVIEHNFDSLNLNDNESVMELVVEENYEDENPNQAYFQLHKNLKEIEEKLKSINLLLRQRKKNTFGKIEKLDRKIKIYFKTCEELIEENENFIKDLNIIFSIKNKKKRQRLIENMQKYFSSLLLKKILNLRKLEERFFKIKEDLTTKNVSNFDFINENEIKDNEKMLYDQKGNLLKMNEILEYDLTDEMKEIYKSISNLTKLLKEIIVIVNEQGNLMDRIDVSMKIAVESAKETNKNLIITKEVLENSLSGKCLKILLFFNVLVFFLVLIKFFK